MSNSVPLSTNIICLFINVRQLLIFQNQTFHINCTLVVFQIVVHQLLHTLHTQTHTRLIINLSIASVFPLSGMSSSGTTYIYDNKIAVSNKKYLKKLFCDVEFYTTLHSNMIAMLLQPLLMLVLVLCYMMQLLLTNSSNDMNQ